MTNVILEHTANETNVQLQNMQNVQGNLGQDLEVGRGPEASCDEGKVGVHFNL